MLELLIFYLAMLCANPAPQKSDTKCDIVHITMMEKDDGETGDIPPPPPFPPFPRP